MSRPVGVIPLFALVACSHETRIELPAPIFLQALHSERRRPAELERAELRALYLVPSVPRGRIDRPGLTSEDVEVEVLDLIALLDEDGQLYINDVVHAEAPAAYGFGKIDPKAIILRSSQGTFRGARRLFTPAEDVLAALDTGYRVEVGVRGLFEAIVFYPLYDADLYAPYRRAGTTPEKAGRGSTPRGGYSEASFDGEDGKDARPGEKGDSGKNGKSATAPGQNGGRGGRGGAGRDGSEGAPGGSGGDGGNGGDGAPGGAGSDGEEGGAAGPGPTLELSIQPIYSKFYPDEELIFMEVDATHRSIEGGPPLRREHKNYILHRGQRFTITTRGGRGGAGGDGGRGGEGGRGGDGGPGGDGGMGGRGRDAADGTGGEGAKGGNGGDGGDGGDGASGGQGGDGGRGGAGGDGGEILARLAGGESFQRDVRAYITLLSVAGEGGDGGRGGEGGAPGSGGRRGKHGEGGEGGRGGRGTTAGKNGEKGKDGKDGEDGDSGRAAGASGRDGQSGAVGRPRATAW